MCIIFVTFPNPSFANRAKRNMQKLAAEEFCMRQNRETKIGHIEYNSKKIWTGGEKGEKQAPEIFQQWTE